MRTFTCSAENQLLTVLSAGQTIKYSYGPAARRVRTKIDGVITHFTHAGDMEIAEYDNSGNLLRRYIPGPGVDQRVLMVICGTSGNCRPNQAGTDTQYYFADRLGNVLAVTDNTGAIEQRYFYTPFGVEMQGDETGNPFRYTGRRYDAETGLYYYRARYYDADLGRFLQVDPIGYADQYNLYAYVGNSPLNGVDPTGKEEVPVGVQPVHATLIDAQRAAAVFIGETLGTNRVRGTDGDFEVAVSIQEVSGEGGSGFKLRYANISDANDGDNADHTLRGDGSIISTVHNHRQQSEGARDSGGRRMDRRNMGPSRNDRDVAETGQELRDENNLDERFELGIVTPDGALSVWEDGRTRVRDRDEVDPPGTYDYTDN